MILRIGNRFAFTLVEILMAVVVLSLGFVIVYEAFFVSLELFRYYADYLELGLLMENKFWELKDVFMHTEEPVGLPNPLSFMVDNRIFNGNLDYVLLDKESGLYRIDLIVWAKFGKRERRFLRTAYVSYRKNE